LFQIWHWCPGHVDFFLQPNYAIPPFSNQTIPALLLSPTRLGSNQTIPAQSPFSNQTILALSHFFYETGPIFFLQTNKTFSLIKPYQAAVLSPTPPSTVMKRHLEDIFELWTIISTDIFELWTMIFEDIFQLWTIIFAETFELWTMIFDDIFQL
jgi:hypothetical protein